MTNLTLHLTLITGSSRGVGAALVEQLIAPGQQILGIARGHNAVLQVQADSAGVALSQWSADLAEPLAVAQRLREWLTSLNAADFASVTLINNAGLTGALGPAASLQLNDLSTSLRVGLEATVLLSAAFLGATAGWTVPRKLMNISSGLGRFAMAGSAAYCAAKAGMDNFSRALALEESALANGARVESVAPGVIDTDMQASLRAADVGSFPERARFVAMHEQGQLISPTECARRLLAKLARADFGQEVLSDIRA